MFKCKVNQDAIDEFRSAICNDTIPSNKQLLDYLRENPNSLMGEVGYKCGPMDSVIYGAVSCSNFHLVAFILKQKNNHFAQGVQPFFCGSVPCNFSSLSNSAGINFYLALVALDYYAEKNNLSHLLEEDESNRVVVKKTHYDCLYWQGCDGVSHHEILLPNEKSLGSIVDFTKDTAMWFMRFAYKVFNLEQELKKELQPKSFATQIRDSLFSPTPRKTLSQLYDELGDCYLHIAHMEACQEKAFCYFLQKSLDCYRRADKDRRDICKLSELEECINVFDAEKMTKLNSYFCSQRDKLKECGVATENYTFDADKIWSNAFELAGEQIRSQGIASCTKLWDADVDSGRTSSEERHSRDSDVQEGKHADVSDELVNNRHGLHRRPNAAQERMTSNPMLAKTNA